MKRNQHRKLVPQKVGPLDKRRRPRGLTRAIRTAIDAIIFDRCSRAEACAKAGISERALYLGLEKVEVAAYWRKATDVLRTGERAANLHALVRIRDSDQNANASVKAVQVIEALETEAVHRPHHQQLLPGLIIQVLAGPRVSALSPAMTIEGKPEPALPRPAELEPPAAPSRRDGGQGADTAGSAVGNVRPHRHLHHPRR